VEPGATQDEPGFSARLQMNEVFYVEHGHKRGGLRR
jgi:hypothetical protein